MLRVKQKTPIKFSVSAKCSTDKSALDDAHKKYKDSVSLSLGGSTTFAFSCHAVTESKAADTLPAPSARPNGVSRTVPLSEILALGSHNGASSHINPPLSGSEDDERSGDTDMWFIKRTPTIPESSTSLLTAGVKAGDTKQATYTLRGEPYLCTIKAIADNFDKDTLSAIETSARKSNLEAIDFKLDSFGYDPARPETLELCFVSV